MPIKFRCAYCNQLMGIARRKAGAVVSCPGCRGQIVVPDPDVAVIPIPIPEPAAVNPVPVGPGNLFDVQNFDAAVFQPNVSSAPAPVAPASVGTEAALDYGHAPMTAPQAFDAAPTGERPAYRGRSRAMALLMAAAGLGIAIVAFIAGFFAGRAF